MKAACDISLNLIQESINFVNIFDYCVYVCVGVRVLDIEVEAEIYLVLFLFCYPLTILESKGLLHLFQLHCEKSNLHGHY